MYRYGKEEKKIMFADTDKRHAELRLKLRRDGLSQVEFFKSILTGYIQNDPNIVSYIAGIKEDKKKIGKAKIETQKKLIESGNKILEDLGLTEKDLDFVYDLIERGDDDI